MKTLRTKLSPGDLLRRFEVRNSAVRWLLLIGLSVGASNARPQDLTDLLDVLKEKGILTQAEYDRVISRQRLKRESNREEMKFRAAEAAKEEIKAATKDDVKGGFRDGFTFESADKRHSISLRGRAELDYRNFGGDDGANADTFDLRRAYFSIEGKLYDSFEYRVRGNLSTLSGPATTVCTAVGPTSPTNPTPVCTQTAAVANTSNTSLDEAWLNINWSKAAQLKFGQFKMPYSLEQMQTELYTDFMERSLGDTISPGKERGLQLWGYPKDGISYALALSNGQGINANETNNLADNKDLLARGSVNFAELLGRKNFVAHLGASYSDGTLPVAAAFSGRNEARGVTFFAPIAFSGDDVDRKRLGVEAALAFGAVKVQAERMQTSYSGRSSASAAGAVATEFEKDIDAYYVSLTWMATGEHYADGYRNGLFARPRPLSNFARGGTGRGAWELGMRYSQFDASDFQTTGAALAGSGVKPATSANEASALTFGVKWLPNPNVRLMLNYIETKFDTPVTVANTGRAGRTAVLDAERAVTLRTQVDF